MKYVSIKNGLKRIGALYLSIVIMLSMFNLPQNTITIEAAGSITINLYHNHAGVKDSNSGCYRRHYDINGPACDCGCCYCDKYSGTGSSEICSGCGHGHHVGRCGVTPKIGDGYDLDCDAGEGDLIGYTVVTKGWQGEHYYLTFTTTWITNALGQKHEGVVSSYASDFKGNVSEMAGGNVYETTTTNKIEIFANGDYACSVYYKDYYNQELRVQTGTINVDDYGTVFSYDPNTTSLTPNSLWGDAISTNPSWYDIGKTVILPNREVQLKSCPWTREGYTFVGWSVNPHVSAGGLTGKTVYEDQKSILNTVKNSANYSQSKGHNKTVAQLQNSNEPLLIKGKTGEKADNKGAWRGTHRVTLYAIWMPNEYYVYYDKGRTDDRNTNITINKSIANGGNASIRTSNITARSKNAVSGLTQPFNAFTYVIDNVDNSKITQLSYTKTFFDHKVTFGNISPIKGRSYELVFNPNFPDTNSEGGAATQEIKDSYNLNLTKTDTSQTINENVDGNYKSKELYGYLFSANNWVLTDYRSGISSTGVVTRKHVHSGSPIYGGGCYTVANYHKHTGNATTGGGCYTIKKTHAHIDKNGTIRNSNYHAPVAGGCFNQAVGKVHSHKDKNGRVQNTAYFAPTSGGCFTYVMYALHAQHQHKDKSGTVRDASYHASSSGGCFTQVVFKKHQHKDKYGVVRAANYEAHESGGCFTKVYYKKHQHKDKYGIVRDANYHAPESGGCFRAETQEPMENCYHHYDRYIGHYTGPQEGHDNDQNYIHYGYGSHNGIPCYETFEMVGYYYTSDFNGNDDYYVHQVGGGTYYALSCGKVAGERYAPTQEEHIHKDKYGNRQTVDYQASESGGCFNEVHYYSHTHDASCYGGHDIERNVYGNEGDSGGWESDYCKICGRYWGGEDDKYDLWDPCPANLQCGKVDGANPANGAYYTCNCGKEEYEHEGIDYYGVNCGRSDSQRYQDEGIDYYVCNCGRTAGVRYSDEAVLKYEHTKSDSSSTFVGYKCNCGKNAGGRYLDEGVDYYIKNCNSVTTYALGCGKVENVTIDSYSLGCGKTTETIETITTSGLLTPTMDGTINVPNYENTEGAWCLATAQWKDTTITNFPEPTMYGYVFLGWYDSPNYTLTPNGDGTFKYTTTAHKITTRTINPSRDSHAREDLYAHWMPKMAYLNYSFPSDDGTKNNYTDYKNGHVVNDLNNGNLTTEVHVGKYYWEYAGRSEASAFFENARTRYVSYATIPNPAVYFKVELYPRTQVNTINLNTSESNYSVLMPNKFLDTVFKFNAPKDGGGSGTSKTLYAASVAAQNWNQSVGAGVTYGTSATGSGNTYGSTKGAQAEGSINKYTLYDVWTLAGWHISNVAETNRDTVLTTGNSATATALGVLSDKKVTTPYDSRTSAQRLDLTTSWNKRSTDLKLPLPKRLLVFDLDVEDGTILGLDSSDSMNNLRKLARGEAVAYGDGSGKDNVYQGKKILTDTSHCLVYDFTFENWVNGTTGQTYRPLANVYTDKDTQYYAKWNLNTDITLPQAEKEGYVFIGWYTVPQDIIPSTAITDATKGTDTGTYGNTTVFGAEGITGGDVSKYWAGGGYEFVNGTLQPKTCVLQKNNCVIPWNITSNKVTLYAWYNRKPVFVDVYEGLFFEGQDVSMYDLKKLVGVFDFEDDYSAIALEYIESLPTVDKDALYLPIIVDKDVDFEEDKDYSESEILETIQIENYVFDSNKWWPVTSAYWQSVADSGDWAKIQNLGNADYTELPNAAEEGSAGDIQSSNHPLSISNGKLISPRHPEGIDGVYLNKEKNEIYYTAEAKEELAYYIQNTETNYDGAASDMQDDYGHVDFSSDYIKYTGLKLKVKSIDYKVKNNTAVSSDSYDVNIPITNIKDYDRAITQYKTVPEKDSYTGTEFRGRDGKLYTRKISKYRLDTSSSRLIYGTDEDGDVTGEGTFTVTYEITDNGIMFNGVLINKTPITLTYTRECKIQYNKLPQIATANIVDFTSTPYPTYKDFEDMILDSQVVIDGEDNVTNLPWWTKTKTAERLANSLEVTGVEDIRMDNTLLEKYGYKPTDSAVQNLKNISSLKDLYNNYYGTDLWKCISSFDVIVDAHDQWGKCSSGNVVPNYLPKSQGGDGIPDGGKVIGDGSGNGVTVKPIFETDEKKKQTKEFRKVSIILINVEDDLLLNDANVMETVRFINPGFSQSSVADNSYWSTSEAQNTLNSIFSKQQSKPTSGTQKTTDYTTTIGSKVNITINDYSD